MSRMLIAIVIFGSGLAGAGFGLTQSGPQAERGAKVYAEQRCSLCHSIAGKGNPKGPLDEVGAKLSAEEIREWIVNPAAMTQKTKAERKPPMKAYPNLPEEELGALVQYMLSLKGR